MLLSPTPFPRRHIDNHYPEEAAKYEGALLQLNKGREELRACSKVDEATRLVAMRHVLLFTAASRHFSFGEGPEAVRCRFVWTGGLLPKDLDGYDAAVELRNARIAAASCFMAEGAAAFGQDSEAGTKKAAGCFASAAGLVAGLAGCPQAALLEAVCLAQAQECFVWAAERSGKAGATVATLAWGAEERLEAAQSLAAQHKLTAWAQRLEKHRALMYAVAATGEAREEDRSGSRHGEKIGRLIEGTRRLKTHGADAGMEKQLAHYTEMLERLTRVHLKENDTIYFQRVGGPSAGAGKMLAKPAAMAEEEDAFAGLVAPHVLARVQRYAEWRTMRLQTVYSEADKASEEAGELLRKLGLPGALDALESGVPAALRSKAEEVLRSGGEGRLREMRTAKEQLESEARRLIAAATATMDEEARQQTGGQTPSQLLTLGMRQELARLGAALEAASQSDALVARKSEEMAPHLAQLAQLDRVLGGQAVASAAAPEQHAELREALAKLDGLLRERHALLASLKERARSEQPAAHLGDFGTSDEAAFAVLMGRYEGEEKQLRDNVTRQAGLLEAVQRLNGSLAGSATPRVAACQALARACQLYFEVADNEREGITFYTDLQALLMRLNRSAQDFAFARATERNDMRLDPARNAASASLPSVSPPPYGSVSPPPFGNASPPPYGNVAAGGAPPPAYNNYGNSNNSQPYGTAPAPYTTHAASAPPPPYNPYGYQ